MTDATPPSGYEIEFFRRFDLAGQLLSLRLEASITQADLAERSGLSQADIGRYEHGLGNPTRSTILNTRARES